MNKDRSFISPPSPPWAQLTAYFGAYVRILVDDRHLPSIGFVFLWAVGALIASQIAIAVLAGAWILLPLLPICAAVVAPWSCARHILIPLGLSRSAQRLTALSGWTFPQAHRKSGTLVAGAWALLHQNVPNRNQIDRLERLRDQSPELTAVHILATGLIAAARGDLASARVLLESIEEVGPNTTPRAARALASEWLLAEAASSGDWGRVCELAHRARKNKYGPIYTGTRAAWLLMAVATRLCPPDHAGAPAPMPTPMPTPWLWALWLLAPARMQLWPLVRRAAGTRPRPAPAVRRARLQLGTSLRSDLYRDALHTHVHLIERASRDTSADALRSLASVWDTALDNPETAEALKTRAATLGAHSADNALAGLRASIAADVAEMVCNCEWPISSWSHESLLLGQAEHLVRERLISEIEVACEALEQTIERRRSEAQNEHLPAIDEWQAWLALRTMVNRAKRIGGDELRRLMFPQMHRVACNYAVWLWNKRRQRVIANAMFRWLLDEALAVGDAQAIELERRNWDETY